MQSMLRKYSSIMLGVRIEPLTSEIRGEYSTTWASSSSFQNWPIINLFEFIKFNVFSIFDMLLLTIVWLTYLSITDTQITILTNNISRDRSCLEMSNCQTINRAFKDKKPPPPLLSKNNKIKYSFWVSKKSRFACQINKCQN